MYGESAVKSNSKFLNEWQNFTEVPLIFINSGKGSDLTTLLGVTNMTSVCVKVMITSQLLNIIYGYTPRTGCPKKEAFRSEIEELIMKSL